MHTYVLCAKHLSLTVFYFFIYIEIKYKQQWITKKNTEARKSLFRCLCSIGIFLLAFRLFNCVYNFEHNK